MTLDEIELERRLGKIEGMIGVTSANMVEIKDAVHEIKEQLIAQNGKVGTLWMDRSMWNWVLRGFVIATPIIVVVVNFYTSN